MFTFTNLQNYWAWMITKNLLQNVLIWLSAINRTQSSSILAFSQNKVVLAAFLFISSRNLVISVRNLVWNRLPKSFFAQTQKYHLVSILSVTLNLRNFRYFSHYGLCFMNKPLYPVFNRSLLQQQCFVVCTRMFLFHIIEIWHSELMY